MLPPTARSRVDANRKGCTVTGNDCACTEETPEKCLSVQQEYHDKIEEVKKIVNKEGTFADALFFGWECLILVTGM